MIHGEGWQFIRLGRYLERFERNVWIGFYEDFKSGPRAVLRDIFRFLGVGPEFSPDMARRHLEAQVPRIPAIPWLKRTGVWRAAASVTPAHLRPLIRRKLMRNPGSTRMDPADRRFLLDFYREDIRSLSTLLGRNLDAWLIS